MNSIFYHCNSASLLERYNYNIGHPISINKKEETRDDYLRAFGRYFAYCIRKEFLEERCPGYYASSATTSIGPNQSWTTTEASRIDLHRQLDTNSEFETWLQSQEYTRAPPDGERANEQPAAAAAADAEQSIAVKIKAINILLDPSSMEKFFHDSCVKSEEGTLVDAKTISTRYAALSYVCRLLSFHLRLEQSGELLSLRTTSSSASSSSSTSTSTSMLYALTPALSSARVQVTRIPARTRTSGRAGGRVSSSPCSPKEVARLLVDTNRETGFATLCAIGNALKNVRSQELPGHIGFLSDSGQEITYVTDSNSPIRVSIRGLRNAASDLLAKASLMAKDLLEGCGDPLVHGSKYARDKDPGFENQHVGAHVIFGGTPYVWEELSCILPNHLSGQKKRRYLNKDDAVSGKLEDVEDASEWLKKYRKLQEVLMVLVYLTMGGAPRISELREALFWNTTEGLRSLYVIPSSSSSTTAPVTSSDSDSGNLENHRNQFVLVLRYCKVDGLPSGAAKARCFLMIWKELENLWRLNFAVLRPTAMSISMNLQIHSDERIATLRSDLGAIDAEARKDLLELQILKISDNVRKEYSPLFVGRNGGAISNHLFHDFFGKWTAKYFEGASETRNPLTSRLFRQAFTTIVDVCAPRVGFLPPCAYRLSIEEQQQQQSFPHGSNSGSSSLWDMLSVHSLRQLQYGGGGGGGNATINRLASDVEAGAIRQTGHSQATHHKFYGMSRHFNPVLPLHQSHGLSSYEMRQQLQASLWYQNEMVIETTVSLDRLFEVLLFTCIYIYIYY